MRLRAVPSARHYESVEDHGVIVGLRVSRCMWSRGTGLSKSSFICVRLLFSACKKEPQKQKYPF